MYMWCKVNNRLTLTEVHNMTPKKEDMEVMEDMKVMEDIEAEEGFEEHLAKNEDRSSTITGDNRVISHETIRQLPVPIVKPSITLLNSAWYC